MSNEIMANSVKLAAAQLRDGGNPTVRAEYLPSNMEHHKAINAIIYTTKCG